MTSTDEIRSWLNEGKDQGATHVLVVCDEFDHSDYPVFVLSGEDPREIAKEHSGEMSRVMECYALHFDFEKQLNEPSAQHYESPPVSSMQRGVEIHKHVEEWLSAKDRHGNDIPPNSLYHSLLAKSGKTHEQAQAGMQADYEERVRVAAHEATRPKPELDKNISKHLFIEALIELCEKHQLAVTVGSTVHQLNKADLDDLRALDPLTRPVPFPEAKRPYR